MVNVVRSCRKYRRLLARVDNGNLELAEWVERFTDGPYYDGRNNYGAPQYDQGGEPTKRGASENKKLGKSAWVPGDGSGCKMDVCSISAQPQSIFSFGYLKWVKDDISVDPSEMFDGDERIIIPFSGMYRVSTSGVMFNSDTTDPGPNFSVNIEDRTGAFPLGGVLSSRYYEIWDRAGAALYGTFSQSGIFELDEGMELSVKINIAGGFAGEFAPAPQYTRFTVERVR